MAKGLNLLGSIVSCRRRKRCYRHVTGCIRLPNISTRNASIAYNNDVQQKKQDWYKEYCTHGGEQYCRNCSLCNGNGEVYFNKVKEW